MGVINHIILSYKNRCFCISGLDKKVCQHKLRVTIGVVIRIYQEALCALLNGPTIFLLLVFRFNTDTLRIVSIFGNLLDIFTGVYSMIYQSKNRDIILLSRLLSNGSESNNGEKSTEHGKSLSSRMLNSKNPRHPPLDTDKINRRRPDSNRRITVLQTVALDHLATPPTPLKVPPSNSLLTGPT